jgi:uncharacterized membrane protein
VLFRSTRLRRLVQAGYGLQMLSLATWALMDGVIINGLIALLPAAAGQLILHLRRQAVEGSPLAPHAAWQARTFRHALAATLVCLLLFGPLLFIGLPLLAWAYALIVLWAAWRIARGLYALQKDQPLTPRTGKAA